jgi:superfamily II DNA/RNA helicase
MSEEFRTSRSAGAPGSPRSRGGRRPARTGPGGGRPAARRAPVPGPASELEQALAAAADAPAPPLRTFAELGLPVRLVDALNRRGIERPFAIQGRVLPDALSGRDVLGRAQTGSGKTLAFGLPVLTRLASGRGEVVQGSGSMPSRTPTAPRALVLVPTRELARQVAGELEPLAGALSLRVTTVYGGAHMGRQIDDLRRGVDVVVATPGRLIDLMERGACRLDLVEIAVLDEADHMADLGFVPAVRQILDATPDGGQRLLLSATLDRGVGKLVTDYLCKPVVHAVAPATSPVEEMDHRVFTVRSEDKVAVAAEIAARPARTLFFVRTKHGADRLAKRFGQVGVEAAAIHGNLSQNQRQRAIDGFTAGRPRVLVATDVAARGLHVDDVDLVVHFDLPNDHKDYLHRSGRTARAGATGTVVAFAEPAEARTVVQLHRSADITATTVAVHAGHEAVREIAESGEPVVVRELPKRERRDDRGTARRSGSPRSGFARSGRAGGPRSGVGRAGEAGPDVARADIDRREGARPDRPRREGARREGAWSDGGRRRAGGDRVGSGQRPLSGQSRGAGQGSAPGRSGAGAGRPWDRREARGGSRRAAGAPGARA